MALDWEDVLLDADADSDGLMAGLKSEALDPYPVYPVLDRDGCDELACLGGRSDGCQICSVDLQPRSLDEQLSLLSPTPAEQLQLPQLDWADVQAAVEPGELPDHVPAGSDELVGMQCVNMSAVCGLSMTAAARDELCDAVLLTDCMLSASSMHHQQARRLRCFSVGTDSGGDSVGAGFRPDTPLSEACDDDSEDELLLRDMMPQAQLPRPVVAAVGSTRAKHAPPAASVRILARPAASSASSGKRPLLLPAPQRSLLKRNHHQLRPAGLGMPPFSTDSGDHSYSASHCSRVGSRRQGYDLLTPSPSQSESSSEEETGSMSWCRRKRLRLDSSLAASERLQHPDARQAASSGQGPWPSCSGPRGRPRGSSSRVAIDSSAGSDDASAASCSGNPPERRQNHNSMERMRRDLLRDSLHALRCLVPITAGNERAPKVTVLREAAKFCLQLHHKDDQLTRQKRKLEEQRVALRRRLEVLQQLRAGRR